MSRKPQYQSHEGGPSPLPDGDTIPNDGQVERFAEAYARIRGIPTRPASSHGPMRTRGCADLGRGN